MSPTWDELLFFDDILVYGAKEEIQRDPPTIVIEIYDQDKVGKSEFIGRAIAKPKVKLKENQYKNPTLEWFEIIRGTDHAGELLAAFELLEIGLNDLPALTEPKFIPADIKSKFLLCNKIEINYSTLNRHSTAANYLPRSSRRSTAFGAIPYRSFVLGATRSEACTFHER